MNLKQGVYMDGFEGRRGNAVINLQSQKIEN